MAPSPRVLIVDDSEVMRGILRDIFRSGGYEIAGEAKDGVEAVAQYAQLLPDLVSMDLVMPFKNGIDATREIVKSNPQACVVMCSSLGQEAMVMEAIEAGAMDFITKPPRPEDVLAITRKVLKDAPPPALTPRRPPS